MNDHTDEHNTGDNALLASEYGTLIDQLTARAISAVNATEREARATAAEIVDLGLVLIATFAGTNEFEEAKRLVDARIATKLARLGVDSQNRGREVVREFAMGLLLGARTIVLGRIAP